MKISKLFKSCFILLASVIPPALSLSCNNKQSFNVTFNGDIDYVVYTNQSATINEDFKTQIEPKDENFEIEKIEIKVDNIFLEEEKYSWDYKNLTIPGKYVTSTNLSVHVVAFKKEKVKQLNVSFQGKYVQLNNYEGYLHHQFHSEIVINEGWVIKDSSVTVGNRTLIRDQDYHITNKGNYYRLIIESAALSLKDVQINIISSKSFSVTSSHISDPLVTWTEKDVWIEYDFKTKITPTQQNLTLSDFVVQNGSRTLTPINDYYYNYATSELCVYGPAIIEESLYIDFKIKEKSADNISIVYFDTVAESMLLLSPISDEPVIGREYKARIVETAEYKNVVKSIDNIQIYLNGVAIKDGYSFDPVERIITLHAATMCTSYITIVSKSTLGEVTVTTTSQDIRIEKAVDYAGRNFSTRITQVKDKRFELTSFYITTSDGIALLSSQFIWNSDSNILTITDTSLLVDGAVFIIEPTFTPKCLSAYAETAFDVCFKFRIEGQVPEYARKPPVPDCWVTTDNELEDWTKLDEDQSYHVNQGETLYFKGNNPDGWLNLKDVYSDYETIFFGDIGNAFYNISFTQDEDAQVNLNGNLVSLIDDGKCELTYFGFDEYRDPAAGYFFLGMFWGNPAIRTAPNLPFDVAPIWGVFKYMFRDCPNLLGSSRPDTWILPAKGLVFAEYFGMFKDCINLMASPLIAGKPLNGWLISDNAFNGMFSNCSSLKLITTFFDFMNTKIFPGWTSGVNENGEFRCCMQEKDVPRGTSGVPEGWTVTNEGATAFDYMSWDEVITTVKEDGVNSLKQRLGLLESDSIVNFNKTIWFNSIAHRVKVIAENKDITTTGKNTNLTFEFDTLISDENGKVILKPWNEKIDSTNQWIDDEGFSCSLRSFLNQYVWFHLPLELKSTNVILPVIKSTGKGNGSIECSENEERIWILSHDEIGGWTGEEGCLHNEGSVYSGAYEEAKDAVTSYEQWTKWDFRDEKYRYWLRSPSISHGLDTYHSWAINSYDALLLNSRIDLSFGIAPCFCI